MRGTSKRIVRDDTGMTIIEIMVASAIMFIILTGVLGLVAQTTRMSTEARQQNVFTNAVSAYAEELRTLPFQHIDLEGTGDGVVLAERTVTSEGYAITYRPTVTTNGALKTVRVDVEIVRADGVTRTTTTSFVIRDPDQFLTQADPGARPTVSFTSPTPPDGAVVWDNQWSGGMLRIGATAQAADGRVIDTVSYWVDGLFMCEDSSGNLASWLVQAPSWSDSLFTWDTRQTDLDLFGNPTARVGDGMHSIEIQVIDDGSGAPGTTARYFLVDNHAPEQPGTPQVATGAATTALSWAEAWDGTLPAHGYELDIWRQNLTDIYWTKAADPNPEGSAAAYELASEPFRRYAARVRAFSPRKLYSPFSMDDTWGWSVFESRPRLSGTYVVEKKTSGGQASRYWKVTSNLSVTQPQFVTQGTTTYSFYRVANGVRQMPAVYSGPLNTYTDVVQVNGNPTEATFPRTTYVCEVTYTPSSTGYRGGTQTVILSNSVLTEYKVNAGTYTFGEGTW